MGSRRRPGDEPVLERKHRRRRHDARHLHRRHECADDHRGRAASFSIATPTGTTVPLSDLATVKMVQGPVEHHDHQGPAQRDHRGRAQRRRTSATCRRWCRRPSTRPSFPASATATLGGFTTQQGDAFSQLGAGAARRHPDRLRGHGRGVQEPATAAAAAGLDPVRGDGRDPAAGALRSARWASRRSSACSCSSASS